MWLYGESCNPRYLCDWTGLPFWPASRSALAGFPPCRKTWI